METFYWVRARVASEEARLEHADRNPVLRASAIATLGQQSPLAVGTPHRIFCVSHVDRS